MATCLDCNCEFTSERELGGICDICLAETDDIYTEKDFAEDCERLDRRLADPNVPKVVLPFKAHPDDIFIWPCGTMATREDIDRGEYNHKSDDYRRASKEEASRY